MVTTGHNAIKLLGAPSLPNYTSQQQLRDILSFLKNVLLLSPATPDSRGFLPTLQAASFTFGHLIQIFKCLRIHSFIWQNGVWNTIRSNTSGSSHLLESFVTSPVSLHTILSQYHFDTVGTSFWFFSHAEVFHSQCVHMHSFL